MKEWKIWLYSIVVFFVIVGIIFGLAILFTKLSCNQFAYLNPYEQFRYSIWNGCLIRWNSLWMPYEAIIIR